MDIDYDIIAKYLAGEADPAEEERLFAFRQESQENERLFQELSELWNLSAETSRFSTNEADALWKSHRRKMLLKRNGLRFFRYAAVLVIFAGALFSAWWVGHNTDKSTLTEITVKTRPGQHGEVVLPDSTHIWLNTSSVLAYPSDFSRTNRRVRLLEGGAVFQVSQSAEHQFVVNAGDLDIKVFGTLFEVRSYGKENTMEVALQEGKVKVLDKEGNTKADLRPGELFTWDKRNEEARLSREDISLRGIWRNPELKIRNQPLDEVIALMEAWYGVRIDIEGKLSSGELYWMTIKSESLREMLDLMARITPLDYTIDDRDVKLQLR